MMAKGLHLQGDEPPDSSERNSQGPSRASASEWPYMAFVAGVFLLITIKSLLF
jgi:hypothetical protein